MFLQKLQQLPKFILYTLLIIFIASCSPPSTYITVEGGDFYREASPVIFAFSIDESTISNPALRNTESGEEIPIQEIESGKWIFMLDEPILANESRNYEVITGSDSPFDRVAIEVDKESAQFKVDDAEVMTYHIATQNPPEGNPAYYRRSGFIHPFNSPRGQVLTDDFPKDHMHQHGIFFAWTNTQYKGEKVDFWNQHSKLGTVSHSKFIGAESGAVLGRMVVEHDHWAFPLEDTTLVLKEIWEIELYRRDDYFIWDITSRMTCQTDSPLHVVKYHYGGMGFRGNGSWSDHDSENGLEAYGPGQGQFLSSEGKTRTNGNHSRPKWASLYGNVDGVQAGMAVMDHPSNFRFPQPVRIHPSMPYFVFAPMVDGQFDLVKGEEYISKYRVVSFQGEPESDKLNQIWEDYANPVNAFLKTQ